MTHYYEIYPGGITTGEIVVEAGAPDKHGLVRMRKNEYDSAFSRAGREMRHAPNYHRAYDVTTLGDIVVLHPSRVAFDDPRVAAALKGE